MYQDDKRGQPKKALLKYFCYGAIASYAKAHAFHKAYGYISNFLSKIPSDTSLEFRPCIASIACIQSMPMPKDAISRKSCHSGSPKYDEAFALIPSHSGASVEAEQTDMKTNTWTTKKEEYAIELPEIKG